MTTVDDPLSAPLERAAREVMPAYLRLGLSIREMQVLYFMSHGLSNPAIGRKLEVSEDTVKTHGRRLFRKLQVGDRAHAVRRGFEQGLLTACGDPSAVTFPLGAEAPAETPLAQAQRLSDPGKQLLAALQSLGWTPPGVSR